MTESMPSSIRIALVDSRTLVRAGLCAILEHFPQMQVIGEADCLREALELIRREQPGIVLFDTDSTDNLGLEAIPQILAASPKVRLVFVTGASDADLFQRAIELGATGIVQYAQPVNVLIKAIEKVNSGEAWLDRMTIASVLGKMSNRNQKRETDPELTRIARLGAREREIIALAGQGLRNKEIGERLSIGEVTVRHHFTSIFSKLEVSDRLELIIFSYRHRLAQPPR